MRKSFKVVFGCLLFVLISGVITILVNIDKIGNDFFSFSIIDSISLLTSIIIGFAFTYLISISFSKENKNNEIIEEVLSSITEDYMYLMNYLTKYQDKIIKEKERQYVLSLSKNIDKDINILMKLCTNKNYMEKNIIELKKQRSNFNYILTGDKLVSNEKITDKFIDNCYDSFYLVKQSIFQCKIDLYSN